LRKWCGNLCRKKQDIFYVLDRENLRRHFTIIQYPTQLQGQDLEKAVFETYTYRTSIFVDLFIVVLNLVLRIGTMFAPVMMFVVLEETSYEPYSRQDPRQLYSKEDYNKNPFYFFIEFWSLNPTTLAFIATMHALFLFNIIDDFIFYWQTKFPVDRSF
jgi:hypothetical protein